MSNANVDTLSDRTGTKSPTITGGELSRARFNLNGTGTIAARDSFNISSFTDNGTGDYTSTFSTAFPNADITASGSIMIGGESTTSSCRNIAFVSLAVGSIRNICLTQSGVTTDYNFVLASAFGDKP